MPPLIPASRMKWRRSKNCLKQKRFLNGNLIILLRAVHICFHNHPLRSTYLLCSAIKCFPLLRINSLKALALNTQKHGLSYLRKFLDCVVFYSKIPGTGNSYDNKWYSSHIVYYPFSLDVKISADFKDALVRLEKVLDKKGRHLGQLYTTVRAKVLTTDAYAAAHRWASLSEIVAIVGNLLYDMCISLDNWFCFLNADRDVHPKIANYLLQKQFTRDEAFDLQCLVLLSCLITRSVRPGVLHTRYNPIWPPFLFVIW